MPITAKVSTVIALQYANMVQSNQGVGLGAYGTERAENGATFNYYREMARDARDNNGFIAQGKLAMPLLVYGGGNKIVGRSMYALDSWQRVASDVCGRVAEGCGHWIPEERPAWVVERLLEFFATVDERRMARAAQPATPAQPVAAPTTAPVKATGEVKTMFCKTIDTALIDVESLPWIPFTPYSDEIFLKLIKADPVRGEWVVLLKVPGGSELPMHNHSGTVMVWTISGSWRYKEHSWVATAGSFVFETAGTRHTPIALGDEESVTLDIVVGDLVFVSPEGAVLAIENWKSMVDRYLNFCKANGIKPVDVTSFSA